MFIKFLFFKDISTMSFSKKYILITIFFITPFLSGCFNTTARLEIPDIASAKELSKNFKNIQASESQASFALAKLINDIDRGDSIFAFPAQTETEGTLCNYGVVGDETITYGGGRQYLGNWSSELGEVFYETLTNMGYSVAGDPADLFNQQNIANSAEYLIGGRLLSMKGNFCHAHHWWDGRPLYKYSGELFVEFEWSILNTLTKDVIHQDKTSGYFLQKESVKDGVLITFENAFAEAAEKFASNNIIRDLATGKAIKTTTLSSKGSSIRIQQGQIPKKFDIDNIKDKVVTIRIGVGHGSGFFIGSSGLVMTNAHVVGDAKTVQIITSSGIEISGKVLKRNKSRDVALIQTPLKISSPLFIDLKLPNITSKVYAIGSPILEELSTTVTQGIVSSIRKDKATGVNYIQGDVAISPGNSGGPLISSKGQIIGISVASYVGNNAQGLNLFIPISDAFNKLNIKIK